VHRALGQQRHDRGPDVAALSAPAATPPASCVAPVASPAVPFSALAAVAPVPAAASTATLPIFHPHSSLARPVVRSAVPVMVIIIPVAHQASLLRQSSIICRRRRYIGGCRRSTPNQRSVAAAPRLIGPIQNWDLAHAGMENRPA